MDTTESIMTPLSRLFELQKDTKFFKDVVKQNPTMGEQKVFGA
jgi:hypothetical protein